MLKLYYSKKSCSSAVLMTAKSLGIELKVINVDIIKGVVEGGKDYSSVTQKGYVPALELENGEVITEVVAICAYLSSLKAGNDIFPLSGKGMITQLEWFNYIATELHQNYMPLIYQVFGMDVNEQWIDFSIQKLHSRYQYVEAQLMNREYLAGSALTSADFYLLMTLVWANLTHFDLTEFPNILAYQERMMANMHVKAVLS